MSEQQQTPRVATVKVPILREVLAQLGTERGVELVGECCDLVAAGLWDAFDRSKLPPMVKAIARGPLELSIQAGRAVVVAWARKQAPRLVSGAL